MAGESELKFLPIRKALSLEPAEPAMMEHTLERTLCEQLIWRRGAHLWQDEPAVLSTLLEGSKRAGFGGAVLAVSDVSLIDELWKEADGIGLICGPAEILAEPSEEYIRIVEQIADQADAVFLQGNFDGIIDDGLKRELLSCLKASCEAVHRTSKQVIWVDRSIQPLPPEEMAGLPFDGLQLTDRYGFSTAEAIRRYGDRFCLLGRTDFSRLAEMSPMELIRDHARLWELCSGKGYIFGTGDIDGRLLPYLTFISMITAVNRLK